MAGRPNQEVPLGAKLRDWTWQEASEAAQAVLLVPVGSFEQHGPHLPLDTDTRIACAIAGAAVARIHRQVVVAPAVEFGASGEHASFAGTLSIGSAVLTQTLIELGRSSDHFAGVVFVNGHGGNAAALQTAETTLNQEGRNACAWSWQIPGADAHAGYTETCLMLAIAPELVRTRQIEQGETAPLAEIWDELRRGGVGAVSANGVLGDPTGADAKKGVEWLEECADQLAEKVLSL